MNIEKEEIRIFGFPLFVWERVLEMQSVQRVQGHACGVKVQRVQKFQRVQRVVVAPSAMSIYARLRWQRCQKQRKP